VRHRRLQPCRNARIPTPPAARPGPLLTRTPRRGDRQRDRAGARQVADAAINAELDRREKPGIADLVTRLRVESDLRRGRPYTWGYPEGERWAREVASWAEICRFAMICHEKDVQIEVGDIVSDGWRGTGPYFTGKFQSPEDYDPLAPTYIDENGDQVDDPIKGAQYWRGWLAVVKAIFEMVRVELEPIPPPPKPIPPPPPPVDPNDIPF
jgi:hypothetical protein